LSFVQSPSSPSTRSFCGTVSVHSNDRKPFLDLCAVGNNVSGVALAGIHNQPKLEPAIVDNKKFEQNRPAHLPSRLSFSTSEILIIQTPC
jgi:hypothetical protein